MCQELSKETKRILKEWLDQLEDPNSKISRIKLPCSDFLRRVSIVRVTTISGIEELIKEVSAKKCQFYHSCKCDEKRPECGSGFKLSRIMLDKGSND